MKRCRLRLPPRPVQSNSFLPADPYVSFTDKRRAAGRTVAK